MCIKSGRVTARDEDQLYHKRSAVNFHDYQPKISATVISQLDKRR